MELYKMLTKVKCYYRLCDKSRMPEGTTWELFLNNFIKNFMPNPDELIVYIDNSSDETIKKTIEICNKNNFNYKITKDGDAVGFYNVALDACKESDDTVIYFIESDYIHRKMSKEALLEVFNTIATDDYATLYDHPDKYFPYYWDTNRNSYVSGLCEVEEQRYFKSTVHFLQSGWWKTTPSTCMTFACTAKTLKKDIQIVKKNTFDFYQETKINKGKDYSMFVDLGAIGRKVYSPMPSYSAHAVMLPTGIDWNMVLNS